MVAETVLTEACAEQAGQPGQPQAPPVDAAQQSVGHAQQQTQPKATNEPAHRLKIEDNMTISFKNSGHCRDERGLGRTTRNSSDRADPNGHAVGSGSEHWSAES